MSLLWTIDVSCPFVPHCVLSRLLPVFITDYFLIKQTFLCTFAKNSETAAIFMTTLFLALKFFTKNYKKFMFENDRCKQIQKIRIVTKNSKKCWKNIPKSKILLNCHFKIVIRWAEIFFFKIRKFSSNLKKCQNLFFRN